MRSLLALTLLATTAQAQTSLSARIKTLAEEVHGKVYVACSLPGTKLDCALDPHGHPPMQSTFKFPLAMAVLHEVELGKLKLDQPIRFEKSDRMPNRYSPMQDAHPDPNVEVSIPVSELLHGAVSFSDNVTTDMLLRLIGGPSTVQAYLHSIGIDDIHVIDSERTLGTDVKLQYRNYAEPSAMVALLRRLADNSPLTPEHTAFLLKQMTGWPTGLKRIPGLLPEGTIVAHKTGTSDTIGGISFATNDVGLITLPNGKRLAIAIFVIDSTADLTTREGVIARIAKAVYDEASATNK